MFRVILEMGAIAPDFILDNHGAMPAAGYANAFFARSFDSRT
jgi:hypothetical protein